MYKKRNFKRRPGYKKKRWYVNASANLPFVGKTSFAMGNKTKRSIISLVRNRLEDPLHKLWNDVQTTILYNGIYTLNLTGNIPQGTTDNTRTGDNIHLEALKFRCYIAKLNGVVTNPNQARKFRILLYKSDVASGQSVDTFTAAVGSTQIFHQPCSIVENGMVNSKLVTLLYDKSITMNAQVTNTSQLISFNETIPIKQTFTYKTGQNYGKDVNYYLSVMVYEPGAVAGTTNCGVFTFQGDLIFKDSK